MQHETVFKVGSEMTICVDGSNQELTRFARDYYELAATECRLHIATDRVAAFREGAKITLDARRPDLPSDLRKVVRGLWLESKGPGKFFPLHSSGILWRDKLVLFYGEKRSGKSTLMLDAVLNHGAVFVTNDGAYLDTALRDHRVRIGPYATLAKVRHDVATRHRDTLRSRMRQSEFSERLWAEWENGIFHDSDRSLYVPFRCLGAPFMEIELRPSDIHLVSCNFSNGGGTRLERGSTLEEIGSHLKLGVTDFAAIVTGSDAISTESPSWMSNANSWNLRHEGDVGKFFCQLSTETDDNILLEGGER